MRLAAIFFDVGETLVDETEVWGGWADWLGVPRLTFFAAMGAVLARGSDGLERTEERPVLREVLRLVRPDVDFAAAAQQRGDTEQGFTLDDLYPDALPCLLALRERGYRIGIAANQPARADAVLRRSGLPFEWLLISELEGVQKPDPAFFERIMQVTGLPAASVAYVGDRVDNDVIPAHEAGLVPVHIRRGPWGVLQSEWPDVERAALRLDSLRELPARLSELEAAATRRG
ncbi:MAG TPA: HAD family hydrolase [Candidatus Dormibacteraeota bacterium]|nr:HAD family hydrolase [Candidatus Dormibacteraeota bacterium]